MQIQRLKRLKDFITLLVLAYVLVSCVSSPQITYDTLKREGFYVYVLPEEDVIEYGWQQEITMRSFDRHCNGLTQDETYNPLQVRYMKTYDSTSRDNLAQSALFTVQLGPWPPPWVSGEGWTEIKIESEYIEGNIVWYKEWSNATNGTFFGLIFTDMFNQLVHISSWLSLTETVSLIGELNYVGPSFDTIENPWDCSK